jgi:hypothetical protein
MQLDDLYTHYTRQYKQQETHQALDGRRSEDGWSRERVHSSPTLYVVPKYRYIFLQAKTNAI